jgi:Flp pilus assembly protein TadG
MHRVISRRSRAAETRSSERGQGLVEFALLFPAMTLLFFGIIQMGFLFGGQIALINAVRDGTRYASTAAIGSNPTATVTNAVARAVPGYAGGATVSYSYCYYQDAAISGVPTYSARIHVSVSYGHPLFVPMVGKIIDGFDGVSDNRFGVTVAEDMRVESQPYKSPPGGLSACATP